MSYKDPARKAAWEEAHRPERFRAMKEATQWADAQITLLRGMGIEHTHAEWRELRNDLRKSRLNNATRAALYPDPPK
jgi:hypothetical protein